MKVLNIALLLGSIAVISGCASKTQISNTISPGISSQQIGGNISMVQPVSNIALQGDIALEEALEASLKMHPRLAASLHEIKASEAAAQQAKLFSNPTITYEIEEFGGSGEFSGTDIMSTRLGVSQEIPLGGKRAKNIEAANIATDIAKLDRAAQIYELQTEVKKRFLNVFILQEKLKLEEENVDLVQSSKNAVEKRVNYGEAPSIELTKVEVELAAAQLSMERTKRDLSTSRNSLAAMWGEYRPSFAKVHLSTPTAFTLPEEAALLEQLKKNPAYLALEKNIVDASKAVELAKAEAWPDLEVSGGLQQFGETDDHAFFLEVSLPFPLINRNQGGISEAQENVYKARKEMEADFLELRSSLLQTANQLMTVQNAYLSMEKSIMPAAKLAFKATQKAYTVGEQNYLDLLDAQRTLLDARRERLGLFAELLGLKAELEGMLAVDLES